jgi:hypothetical protein
MYNILCEVINSKDEQFSKIYLDNLLKKASNF